MKKNQIIIGITGSIGTGKTFVSKEFLKFLKKQNINALSINLDDECKKFYEDEKIKKKLIKEFGKEIFTIKNKIDTRKLGDIVFSDNKKLEKLNLIFKFPIISTLKNLKNKSEYIIIVEGALIIDFNLEKYFNKILLINAYKKTQIERLQTRGLSLKDIKKRILSQKSYKGKKDEIQKFLDSNKNFQFFSFLNENTNGEKFLKLFQRLL